MKAFCHPESFAAVVNVGNFFSKSPSLVKTSGFKHDGRAARTAPAAVVDVLGDAVGKRVGATEPPLPGPDPSPPPPPLRGDPGVDPGVDEDVLRPKRSQLFFQI